MTSHTHETSRLTHADYDVMASRIRETASGWAYGQPTRRYSVKTSDVATIVHLMLGAIGCGIADMREAELTDVRNVARAYVGLTYDARGRVVAS